MVWRVGVERLMEHQHRAGSATPVRVTGGYNPFDFSYRLAPGEQLSTPVFNGGYSHQGIGGASRALHRFELTRILPQAPKTRPRPIIYNSWEATGFDVNEDGQEALAE